MKNLDLLERITIDGMNEGGEYIDNKLSFKNTRHIRGERSP